MLYEATLETFEEASLRVQRTLTSLEELMHRKDRHTRDVLEALETGSDAMEHLAGMEEAEKEMEREFRELVIFLDIQNEDVRNDVEDFKEMVSKTAIKNKLENISCFVNSSVYGEKSSDTH